MKLSVMVQCQFARKKRQKMRSIVSLDSGCEASRRSDAIELALGFVERPRDTNVSDWDMPSGIRRVNSVHPLNAVTLRHPRFRCP